MNLSDFIRIYQLRTPKIMWLLGAGASAAADIPTAWHLIWHFKQMLYCTEQRVSIRTCSDLGDPALRARIQAYFDSKGTSPKCDSEEEYAHYFEAAIPDNGDRQRYIDRMFSSARPSFGHYVLAALMKLDMVRLLWTTNFDSLIEDAVADIFGSTGRLTVGSPDAPRLATDALSNERFPILIKLHGDFRSRRLKNTSEELRSQDAELQSNLVEACKRYGLAVVGYSGRDHSVMEALLETTEVNSSFPQGLFWFHRSDDPCLPMVQELIDRLKRKESQAEIIELDTFDELMADLLLLVQDIPEEIQKHLLNHRKRVSDIPLRKGEGTWPVIRLNALPVLSSPVVCRRVVCNIGGAREVRQAIKDSGASIIASRRRSGIIAFGSDAEIKRVFKQYNITEIDLHNIEKKRLRYMSVEHGMLYDAICQALERERPLKVYRRSQGHLVSVDPYKASHHILMPLKKAVKDVTGILRDFGLAWAEAIKVHLEYRFDNLWLLMEPTLWVEPTDDDDAFEAGREFIKSRLTTRYNSSYNEIIDAWAHILTNSQNESEISAFGIHDGCDASFIISRITAFSWRGEE